MSTGTKITDLSYLVTPGLSTVDEILIIDIDDLTDSPEGTAKRTKLSDVLNLAGTQSGTQSSTDFSGSISEISGLSRCENAYSFNEVLDDEIEDLSGESRNITFQDDNRPTISKGLNGKQISDVSTNSVGMIADGSGVSGNTDFTAMLWINTTSVRTNALISKVPGIPSEAGFQLLMNADGTLNFWVALGLSYQFNINTPISTPVNDGNNHHICIQREGLTGRVFIDGFLVAESTGASITNLTSTLDFGILFDNVSNSNHFDGFADDVFIFTESLSLSDIRKYGKISIKVISFDCENNGSITAGTELSYGNGADTADNGIPMPQNGYITKIGIRTTRNNQVLSATSTWELILHNSNTVAASGRTVIQTLTVNSVFSNFEAPALPHKMSVNDSVYFSATGTATSNIQSGVIIFEYAEHLST